MLWCFGTQFVIFNMKNYMVRSFSRTLPGFYSWMCGNASNPIYKLNNNLNSYSRCMSSITGSLMAQSEGPEAAEEKVKFTFILNSGEEVEVEGKVGDNVMRIAVEKDIGMEGACDGSLACTTCHVYIDEKVESIAAPAVPLEEDLLDGAPFLKPNSRLCCQFSLTKEFNGVKLKLPPGTMNMAVDGFKAKKH